MTALEILTGARALLSDKGAWYQGALGLFPDGMEAETWLQAVKAPCRCLVGAIAATVGGVTLSCPITVFELIKESASIDRDACEVYEWNDHPSRTHSEVLQALDKAIELAKERNL